MKKFALHIALKKFFLQQIFLFDIVAASSKASNEKENRNFLTLIKFK